jgi:hypothetical protein
MIKKPKKHTVLGGIKVSSEQLSEWGSLGGRPKKWKNEAERKRWVREQKTKAKGKKLRGYRSYEEIKIKKYLTCPNCGKVNWDLKNYFNEKGEYIPETWWFDTARWEKFNARENIYHCDNCSHGFSFLRGEIKAIETRETRKRAGSEKERKVRSRSKKL